MQREPLLFLATWATISCVKVDPLDQSSAHLRSPSSALQQNGCDLVSRRFLVERPLVQLHGTASQGGAGVGVAPVVRTKRIGKKALPGAAFNRTSYVGG